MYNVEKLEQQWVRYRRKKIIFPAIAGLFIFTVASVSMYSIGSNQHILDAGTAMRSAPKDISSGEKKGAVEKSVSGKLDILSTGVPSLSSKQESAQPKVGQIIFQDTSEKPVQKARKRKNLLIQITERGGRDIAADIENRFEFAKDKSDSLFLAKYYYDKMDYEKAEKWALETNRIDNAVEESWLIFAKSLAKRGKRIEALKVLRALLDKSESARGKKLMDKIRRGQRF